MIRAIIQKAHSMNQTRATRTARITLTVLVVAAYLVTGCADMSERQRGTAAGAGIGAAAGAVLGSATGGSAGSSAVIGGALGAIAGNLWSKRQEDRPAAMEQATRGTGVEVSRTQDNQLKLNIPSDLSFDFGSAAIKPDMHHVLDTFANSLQDDPSARLAIIGHTDSVGTAAVNERLSLDRARSGRDYLASRGVSPARVSIEGHGEREPVADNGSEKGRAQNRRVEMYLREPSA
jgi:outer membrane protein OmpA-like peptidoglycan-associated protein